MLQRRRRRPEPETLDLSGRPAALLTPLPPGSRACCCSAAPTYQVVVAAPDGSSTPEILFCGHHFRTHRRRLQECGAAVYDRTGWPVELPD